MNQKVDKKLSCFVAMPIGSKEETYQHWKEDRYDKEISVFDHWKNVYDNIIVPAVEKSGFGISCRRADAHREPGIITDDILQHLKHDYIAIFDITGKNPNVYYELGVRDCWHNKNIIVTANRQDQTFDIYGQRALLYKVNNTGVMRTFENDVKLAVQDIMSDCNRLRNHVQKFLIAFKNDSGKEKSVGVNEDADALRMGDLDRDLDSLLRILQFRLIRRDERCKITIYGASDTGPLQRAKDFIEVDIDPFTSAIVLLYDAIGGEPDWLRITANAVETGNLYAGINKDSHQMFIFPFLKKLADAEAARKELEEFLKSSIPEIALSPGLSVYFLDKDAIDTIVSAVRKQ